MSSFTCEQVKLLTQSEILKVLIGIQSNNTESSIQPDSTRQSTLKLMHQKLPKRRFYICSISIIPKILHLKVIDIVYRNA